MFNDSKGDVQGFGAVREKVKILTRIVHDGEVNKARYMPQNPNMIATKSPSSNVYVFDTTKHTGIEEEFKPDLTLTGHTKEGYGLCWDPHTAGQLVSGSDDAMVCIWDIRHAKGSQSTLKPMRTLTAHTDVVEDVAWHPTTAHLFGSCGDDFAVMLWDSRDGSNKPLHAIKTAHGVGVDVNCLSFCPTDEHLFATGGSDGRVNIWDIRSLPKSIHQCEGHTEGLVGINWHKNLEGVLATAGKDRRVLLWDLNRIGEEQSEEDAEDGPPELLFAHGGHTDKISDFNWNDSDDMVIASVSEDNMLMIWKVADGLFDDEGDSVSDGDLEDDEEEDEAKDEEKEVVETPSKRQKKSE